MTDATMTMEEGARGSGRARPQDELLPFLNNFHDIFTTIGVILLGFGLAFGAGQILDAVAADMSAASGQFLFIGLQAGIAVIYWLISAVLVGRQRRILPGIVLALGFIGAASTVLTWLYVRFLMDGAGLTEASLEARFDAIEEPDSFNRETVGEISGALPMVLRISPIVFALATVIPVALYYFSFRLPFAGGLFGVSLAVLAGATLLVADPYTFLVYLPAVLVVLGGCLLLAGIVFDARDPNRETRLAGTAFWLHFFAAPILLFAVLNVTRMGWSLSESDFDDGSIFGIFGALLGEGGNATQAAITALIVIGCFAIVALLINRRALIVSGLITAGVSIGVIVNSAGLESGAVVAITLLVLGGTVVLLGAAWNPVRSILLAPFPSDGPLARIFPPVNANEG